jgi:site-specific recombinase XerD
MSGRPRPQQPAIRWERLPLARALPPAREWLEREAAAGLAAGTVDAYSRAVERYLAYCRQRRLSPRGATTAHLAEYLRELAAGGLGPAARLQRLTAIRLFYAFVVERGLRPDNPAAAGTPLLAAPGAAPGAGGEPNGPLPWVPDEAEWQGVLAAARAERPRSRLMLALAYDGALRREELCALRVADVDPEGRVLRVAAGPGGAAPAAAREVPLSEVVAERCAAYLRERIRGAGRDGGAEAAAGAAGGGALFLSESPRNRAAPLAVWGWAKVVRAVARRAGVVRFTPHTPRHLRLTDLARAGGDAREIARLAGHRRPGLARRYVRLARERPGPAGDGTALQRRRTEQLERVLFGAGR